MTRRPARSRAPRFFTSSPRLGAALIALAASAGCQPNGSTDVRPSASADAKTAPSGSATALSSSGARATAAPGASSGSVVAPKKTAWDPATTYAVIVGVIAFQDPSIPTFSDRHRKDRELSDLLVKRGVPADHVVTLIDKDAPAAAVLDQIAKTADKTQPGSTFLFYYAGHGGFADDKGNVTFLAYDVGKDPKTQLDLSKIQAAIADHAHASRVLLFADCCHSGGLMSVADALHAKGFDAVAITSADSSNLSTGNWTFSQTLIDAFAGRALFDHDADGSIDLGELADESAEAMKCRENQRSGEKFAGVDRSFVIATDDGKASPRPSGTFAIGTYAALKQDGADVIGRVVGGDSAKPAVELYDYSDKKEVTVDESDLTKLAYKRYPVGDKLQVLSEGKLWPAEVKRRDGDFHLVTYPGFAPYWDEWVLSDRIASDDGEKASHAKGDKVSVQWQGKWWNASVLEVKGSRTLINYDGYDATWNEWVPPARIKNR